LHVRELQATRDTMKLIIFYFNQKVSKLFVEKTDESGEKHLALSSPYNFVSKGETIAKIIDVEEPEEASKHLDEGYNYYNLERYRSIKVSDGIFYDEKSRTYKSPRYGFVIYDKSASKIRLLSPLQVTRDKLAAYFIIFPTKFDTIPTYMEIEEAIFNRGIAAIVDKESIEQQLSAVDIKEKKITRIIIAKGRKPVDGSSEYYLPLISINKKAGKVLEDGRIDFREVDSIIECKKGQKILKRVPSVKPEDGYDIFGEKADAVMEDRKGYLKGDNIVQSDDDENIFVSSIDGCLNVERNRISVQPNVIIKGNVDYDYGNIDFNGSVHIRGSVLPGFSVKAGGNIIVEKNVEDAYIEADGDIVIKMGITGKGSCKVVANGSIKANYILNSVVEAIKEIEVQDSIINSKVFSNDKISVTAKHGKIIGGEVTARHEVIVNVIGSQKENITYITVGRSLYIEREMNEIRQEMDKWRVKVDDTLRRIKSSFGEGLFENPKEFIKILPPVKKKNCLLLLKELTDYNKELKMLSEKQKVVEKKLKLEREPVIIVKDLIFPGLIAQIKKRKRRVEQKLENVKLFEDPKEKLIRISSAV
jgi:uncharacterized protein (DUF342 family)